jgi:hypothetical protein
MISQANRRCAMIFLLKYLPKAASSLHDGGGGGRRAHKKAIIEAVAGSSEKINFN